MAPAIALPFEGLPVPFAALYWVALLVICAMLAWTAALFVRGLRWRRGEPEADQPGADRRLWVFLVPALNEAITIRDCVARLEQVRAARKLVVVIDDGSDDATSEILAGLAGPDLIVLRREPPHARQGKAAALNHAYRALDRVLARSGTSRADVIVCVVDADGRIDPEAPSRVAPHFADGRTGGVQSLVRIYNRRTPLTWMQDVEFGVYGFLYQAGRSAWGTAGMGGNAQFNRLVALDQIAGQAGPWRDRLTEDQDLGLRLIAAGWRSRQALATSVDQQGLGNIRRLFRQRTRWAQGNLQALVHLPVSRRARLPLAARLDLAAYLLMPFLQGVIGLALVAAIYLAATGQAQVYGGPWYQLLFFYLLGFGGVILGCVARGWAQSGARGGALGFLLAHLYAFYSWLIWPALVSAALRQALGRDGWAKTSREPIAAARPARQGKTALAPGWPGDGR